MSEDKLTHVLVPIEWIKEQKERIVSEYKEANGNIPENGIEDTQMLTEHFTYTAILIEHPHINPAAQQSYIKQLEDAMKELIRCGVIFKNNMLEADVTFEEYYQAYEKAKQSLQSKLKYYV